MGLNTLFMVIVALILRTSIILFVTGPLGSPPPMLVGQPSTAPLLPRENAKRRIVTLSTIRNKCNTTLLQEQ